MQHFPPNSFCQKRVAPARFAEIHIFHDQGGVLAYLRWHEAEDSLQTDVRTAAEMSPVQQELEQ